MTYGDGDGDHSRIVFVSEYIDYLLTSRTSSRISIKCVRTSTALFRVVYQVYQVFAGPPTLEGRR